jgi:hypothetical protein
MLFDRSIRLSDTFSLELDPKMQRKLKTQMSESRKNFIEGPEEINRGIGR